MKELAHNVIIAIANFSAEFDNKMEYNCPIPCQMYEFSAQLSQSTFPSNIAADAYAKRYNLTGNVLENRLFIRYLNSLH